jgi:hypothetical protein
LEYIIFGYGDTMPDVLMISKPCFDMPQLLAIASRMLGYSPAHAADAAGLTGLQHLLSCLAAFRDKNVKAGVKSAHDVYFMLQFAFLIAAEEQDMPLVLEIMGGMEFAWTETKIRGVQAVIIVGTFHQYREAILRGCRQDQPEAIKLCFGKMFTQFQGIGLSDAFGKLTKKYTKDNAFYLEGPR